MRHWQLRSQTQKKLLLMYIRLGVGHVNFLIKILLETLKLVLLSTQIITLLNSMLRVKSWSVIMAINLIILNTTPTEKGETLDISLQPILGLLDILPLLFLMKMPITLLR